MALPNLPMINLLDPNDPQAYFLQRLIQHGRPVSNLPEVQHAPSPPVRGGGAQLVCDLHAILAASSGLPHLSYHHLPCFRGLDRLPTQSQTRSR